MIEARSGAVSAVSLSTDGDYILPGVRWRQLSRAERRAAARLVDFVVDQQSGAVVRRNRKLRVGRTSIQGCVVSVPPPMPARDFVRFLVFALGDDLGDYFRPESDSVSAELHSADHFLVLMAALLVREAEAILRQHVARQYVAREQRSLSVRGRRLWAKDFGRHPSAGVTCRIHELSTDERLNQLILSGLIRADQLLVGSAFAHGAANQVFIWEGLARSVVPRPSDFHEALVRLNRLTEHYRTGVTLARALVYGLGPSDLFSGTGGAIQHVEFSLPVLFELFLQRLLRPVCVGLGLDLRFRHADREALVDGHGSMYREVEPDFTLWRDEAPVAVLDAKFKPRYVAATPDGKLLDKVTNADLYQLFFYQARLQVAGGLESAPRAAIIAPVVGGAAVPERGLRVVQWQVQDPAERTSLEVMPIDLSAALTALERDATSPVGILEASSPEVLNFLRQL